MPALSVPVYHLLDETTPLTAEDRARAFARSAQLYERWQRLLEKELRRNMRSSNPESAMPAEVRAAHRIDRQHSCLTEADRRQLAIAAKFGSESAAQLLILTDPTLARVTQDEREKAVTRTVELYRRYTARLGEEHRRGPRARDEDMLYPAEIRAATYLDTVNQYLQKHDQRLLVIAAKLGHKQATTLLMMANQHAAIKSAKSVKRKDSSLHDMVQSTNVGLLHAIQLYDPCNEGDASYLTFANWHGWQRAMRDGQLSGRGGLRVPSYLDQYCDLVLKVRLHLQQTEQRQERDLDELLALVNEGRSPRNLINMAGLERAVQLLEISYQSLDEDFAGQDGRSRAEQVGVDDTEQVLADIDMDMHVEPLRRWLQRLLGDKYELYVRNQGLFGYEPESVADIARSTEQTDCPLSQNQVAGRVRKAKKLVDAKIERGVTLV